MIAEALAEKETPNDSQALPDSVGAANVSEAETFPAMSEENQSPEILAVLPPFMPSIAGTYTFTASLDVVRGFADFSAGRLYSPVVAMEYDSHSSEFNGAVFFSCV